MSHSTNTYIIFTDGSSRGNPGPGGWGAIVIGQKSNETIRYVIEMGGHAEITTNNKMELSAALYALKSIPTDASVTIYTDSSYLINGMTKWLSGWKRNGWQTKTKQDVSNKDLWLGLDEQINDKIVVWKYVGGHVGVKGNERCDYIATSFADNQMIDLYEGALTEYPIRDILNLSHNTDIVQEKKTSKTKSNIKAYSYVSAVDGVVQTHRTWVECESRVRGVHGAKYRKAISSEDEDAIIESFGGTTL